jgi:hypothetical protein
MSKQTVREALIGSAMKVLVGPYETLECLESAPSDTYLTGILWPRGSMLSADEDDGDGASAGDGEEGLELPVPGFRAIRPCSIGMTFTVEEGVEVSVSLEGSARYVAKPPEHVSVEEKKPVAKGKKVLTDETDSDNDEKRNSAHDVWQRIPVKYQVIVSASEKRSSWRTQEFLLPDGIKRKDPYLAIDIKRRVAGGGVIMTVTLINTAPQPEEGTRRDSLCIFQAGFRVSAVGPGGAPAIHPRETQPMVDDEDALNNLLLYRDVREFATGHSIAAEWPVDNPDAVPWVATSWMPLARVKGTSPEGDPSLVGLRSGETDPFRAAWLGDSGNRDSVCAALGNFCDLYGTWIAARLESRLATFSGDLHTAAARNLDGCKDTLKRMVKGVDTLRNSDSAWQAFALANRAMDDQSRLKSKGERAGPLFWRPFQLAFLLLVIPTIVDPEDDDRLTMDLLWFPTGGGKTEAYLGLTAFQIFFRRLVEPERRNSGGVDVLMRYTLRLLTVQQFQRAAALICACDLIRAKNAEVLGTARISLGLYVGDDSTPNKLADAAEKLDDERNGQRPKSTPRQLLKCPVCGGDLPFNSYRVFPNSLQMEIRCPDKQCPTAGNTIPVMTVDEAMYAEPPSLLIGTIDKFAQIPRRTDIRSLFGLGSSLRPGMIIQDELHLISGPLGTMTGLYEAAIDLLCMDKNGIKPKIIGSTATIGRARRQVRALFDRDVLQFPPSGFEAADSFFAVRDANGPDRTYMGVTSAGRSPKFALQAVVASVLQSVGALRDSGKFDDKDIDPYWTCVAYFNSLRELGGAHVMMQDDVTRQMDFVASRLESAKRPLEEPPKELSSRVSSREIPEILMELERTLGSDDPYEPDPVHAVLASNMISVGVDISRLGLMVVNGQPKSTAEYIQATSRVGRGLPGLVVTLYNFGRPRDVSHFEHFGSYHGALYRSVEATSVTPWAPRARDKALHAVFASLVRHLMAGMVDDENALSFDAGKPGVGRLVDYLVTRARAASEGLEDAETRVHLDTIVATWNQRSAGSRVAGKKLRYWEKKAPFGRTAPHLMRAAEEMKGGEGVAWPTPNSMREVEPSTVFLLKRIPRRQEQKHGDE